MSIQSKVCSILGGDSCCFWLCSMCLWGIRGLECVLCLFLLQRWEVRGRSDGTRWSQHLRAGWFVLVSWRTSEWVILVAFGRIYEFFQRRNMYISHYTNSWKFWILFRYLLRIIKGSRGHTLGGHTLHSWDIWKVSFFGWQIILFYLHRILGLWVCLFASSKLVNLVVNWHPLNWWVNVQVASHSLH